MSTFDIGDLVIHRDGGAGRVVGIRNGSPLVRWDDDGSTRLSHHIDLHRIERGEQS